MTGERATDMQYNPIEALYHFNCRGFPQRIWHLSRLVRPQQIASKTLLFPRPPIAPIMKLKFPGFLEKAGMLIVFKLEAFGFSDIGLISTCHIRIWS